LQALLHVEGNNGVVFDQKDAGRSGRVGGWRMVGGVHLSILYWVMVVVRLRFFDCRRQDFLYFPEIHNVDKDKADIPCQRKNAFYV
jgi:hypothetical protein